MLKCARIFVRRDYTFRKVSDSEARGTVQCLWIKLKLFFVSTEGYYVSYLSFVLKAQGKSTYKQFFYYYDDFKILIDDLKSTTKLWWKICPALAMRDVTRTMLVSSSRGGGY